MGNKAKKTTTTTVDKNPDIKLVATGPSFSTEQNRKEQCYNKKGNEILPYTN